MISRWVATDRPALVGDCGSRIGIDARYLSHGLIGGVNTYVSSLLTAMLRLNSPHRFVLYADSKAPFDLEELPPKVDLHVLPWRSGVSTIKNDVRIGSFMARDGIDLAHFPANYGFGPHGTPTLITLHDAINTYPIRQILKDDSKNPRHIVIMMYLHLMTLQALRRSPAIITVSEYSKAGIMEATGIPASHIHVVHSAQDACFRPTDRSVIESTRARYGLKPFVVLADAIKNPYCTLRAFSALPEDVRDQASLVFFSRREPVKGVVTAARDGFCKLVLRPPRDELIALYSLADVFVFPSWYEGFGLPVLEAMACETPVIASNRGSLPEITGDGGMVVDAEDHDVIASEIHRLYRDTGYRSWMSERALRWSTQFSWERTAQRTLEIYAQLIETTASPESQSGNRGTDLQRSSRESASMSIR